MRLFVFSILIVITFSFCSNKGDEKEFTHVITNEEVSLNTMSSDSLYTVFYCWADWCGPCISSMKSTLVRTKQVTDSIGIPIQYNAILYSLNINEKSKGLMQNAFKNGIETFHKTSLNALTQKLAITSDFKKYEGFESQFMVPRVILINNKGELLTSYFPLNYKSEYFIENMKLQFPSYFGN